MPRFDWEHKTSPVFTAWFTSGGNWKDSSPVGTSYSHVDYVKGTLLISQGNPGFQNLGKSSAAVGGDFQVMKKDYRAGGFASGSRVHFSDDIDPMADGTEHWFANQYAAAINTSESGWMWDLVGPSGMSELDSLGATAISRCIPTNPVYNCSTALGEAREGFPRLGIESWQDRAGRAKSAGSDYLNYEFGWKPLVGEIESFFQMVSKSGEILKKYERDSGKRVHASYKFPDEKTVEVYEEYEKTPQPTLIDALDLGASSGKLTTTITRETKQWFEGVFTYYLPKQGSLDGYTARANKLLGIRLTPETLWELAPWSWAADWVTNTGDVMSNVSRFMSDGLVMPYAYMMETKSVERKCYLDGIRYKCYPGPHSMSQSWKTTYKTRRQASPFAFGFDWDGLTPRQGAILAALAL